MEKKTSTTEEPQLADPPSPDSAIGSPEPSSPEHSHINSAPMEDQQKQLLQQQGEQNEPPSAAASDVATVVAVGSTSGYSEGESEELVDEEQEEEELSESEMVVTGSMQFALTPAAVANISTSRAPASDSDSAASASARSSSLAAVPAVKGNGHSSDGVAEVTAAADSTLSQEATAGHGSSTSSSSANSSAAEGGVLGLPSTVARLEGPGGVEVYVVGTAHFSRESQQDVVTTIERVRPDVVVLELCRARTAILSMDEETILAESTSMDFSKMRAVLSQHGRVQGVLYLLLLSVSAHITKQLGMAPGGEFRVAVATARRVVPKTSIQLGDRPINVTLGRALAALSPWSKLKLAFHIITTTEPISKEDVEKCKDKDMIEELLAEMTGQFPAISEVFVRERDLYLSHSLHMACRPAPVTDNRPPRRVVGVVGIGHLKGIQEHWGQVDRDEINRILIIPSASFANQAVVFALRATLWGLAGLACYKLLPSSAKHSLGGLVATAAAAITLPLSRARPGTAL